MFQIWLYSADNSRYRILPPESVAPGLYGRVVSAGGYEEGEFYLNGTRKQHSDLTRRRQIEYRYVDDFGVPHLLYRGLIRRIRDVKDNKGLRKVLVKVFGIFQDVVSKTCAKKYANIPGYDKGQIAGDLFSLYVSSRFPKMLTDCQLVNDALTEFDSRDQRLSDVLEQLTRNTGAVVYGCDTSIAVDASLRDRFYYRSFDTTPRHTVEISGTHVGTRQSEEDARNQFTVLTIRGGKLKWPNLLASYAENNPGFENPIIGESDTNNILQNPSFEDRVLFIPQHWLLGNGASLKKGGTDTEANADTGSYMVELDADSEYAWQQQDAPAFALVGDDSYVLNVRARLERPIGTSGFSNIRSRIVWRASGSDLSASDWLPIAPAGANYEDFPLTATCPVGATGFRVEIEMPTGGDDGNGVYVDTLSMYRGSAVTQPGWELFADGSSQIKAVNWAYSQRAHSGAYCLYLKGTASGDFNDITLKLANSQRIKVKGSQQLRLCVWVSSPPGATHTPAMQLRIRSWSNSSYKGWTVTDFAYSGTALNGWHQYTCLKTVESDAVEADVHITLRSDGEILIDSIMMLEGAAPYDTFVEGSTYKRTFRAVDLFTSGPLYDEAVELGEIEEAEDQPALTNDTDAEEYARAALGVAVMPTLRPQVLLYGIQGTGDGLTTAEMWPGQILRCIGDDKANILPDDLPIREVEWRWDGKLTGLVSLQVDPESPARKLRAIIRRNLFGITRNSAIDGVSPSSYPSTSGGGSGLPVVDPHFVLAGPTSGGAATATGRLLVASDLPAHTHPLSVQTKTADYTAAPGEVVRMDVTAANRTVTLPTADATNKGLTIRVTKIDSSVNTVTVNPSGGQAVNGTNTALSLQWQTRSYLAVPISAGVFGWDVLP